MRKVAIIYSGGRQWGGIETYLANLFRLRDQTGLDLLLVSLGEWDLTKALRQQGLASMVRVLPGDRVRLSTVRDLQRLIKDERPGLVVSQGVVANAYARLAALVTRTPSLVVVHSDMMLDYPPPRLWAFRFSDWALRAVTRQYIAVSSDLARKLVKQGVPADRVTVIYNGVDSTSRVPTTLHTRGREQNVAAVQVGHGHERPVLLATVGRLHPVKNFDGLIRAMTLLPDRVGLVIWGDGPQRSVLNALVAQLGLGARVSLPGESQDMSEALEGVDMYVQPSHSEGCSYAVAEAMLCGKPVVVTPRGGLPEQVDEGAAGLVADDCSPTAIAKAIMLLVKDEAIAATLGAAGQKAALEKYSVRKWARHTGAALAKVAAADNEV